MIFNSLTFIVFFAIVLVLYNFLGSWRAKKFMLLLCSYLFYAAWNPPFILLLWLSTVIDWFVAKKIYTTQHKRKRFWLLMISLAVNLGLLVFFKYGTFLIDNFNAILGIFGITFHAAAPNIILPVGISFYTFQTLSYTIDVYRSHLRPARSFLDFALFVTFFPQLVAGPIVRASDFLPQLEMPKKCRMRQVCHGLFLITMGLYEKTVLADGLVAGASDIVFGATMPVSTLDAWIGTLAFANQIYFDFAGYTTCAIGAALCLGFYLPDNFQFPYAAIGLSDFWRRWHITLSTWLRDYLYISLGGNRQGHIRTSINLMLTMLLGGLWHGNTWNFVAWGGLHGSYLIIEHALKYTFYGASWVKHSLVQLCLWLLTFVLVLITWVFFRAPTFDSVAMILSSMFGLNGDGVQLLETIEIVKVLAVVIFVLSLSWFYRDYFLGDFYENTPSWLLIAMWTIAICAIILMQGGGHAFIYFQF